MLCQNFNPLLWKVKPLPFDLLNVSKYPLVFLSVNKTNLYQLGKKFTWDTVHKYDWPVFVTFKVSCVCYPWLLAVWCLPVVVLRKIIVSCWQKVCSCIFKIRVPDDSSKKICISPALMAATKCQYQGVYDSTSCLVPCSFHAMFLVIIFGFFDGQK